MSEMPLITVSQAAKRLGRDPRTVRGVAIGLGIELRPVATGLTLTLADFCRIEASIKAEGTKAEEAASVPA